VIARSSKVKCLHVRCQKSFATIGSRNLHMRAKHHPYWNLRYIKRPKWVRLVENQLVEETYKHKRPIRIIDRRPRIPKPRGRPLKPFRSGRPRKSESSRATMFDLRKAYFQVTNGPKNSNGIGSSQSLD